MSISIIFMAAALILFLEWYDARKRKHSKMIDSVWQDKKTGETCVRYRDNHVERHAQNSN